MYRWQDILNLQMRGNSRLKARGEPGKNEKIDLPQKKRLRRPDEHLHVCERMFCGTGLQLVLHVSTGQNSVEIQKQTSTQYENLLTVKTLLKTERLSLEQCFSTGDDFVPLARDAAKHHTIKRTTLHNKE